MFGLTLTQWVAGGGIVLLAVLYETWRQGGLSSIWGYVTKRSTVSTAAVSDQQAFDATMLLARYKATSKGSAGYGGVMAALKVTLEAP